MSDRNPRNRLATGAYPPNRRHLSHQFVAILLLCALLAACGKGSNGSDAGAEGIRQVDVMQTLSQPAQSNYQLLVPGRAAFVRAYVYDNSGNASAAVTLAVNGATAVDMTCPSPLPPAPRASGALYRYDNSTVCVAQLAPGDVRPGLTLTVTHGAERTTLYPAVNTKSVIKVVAAPLTIGSQTGQVDVSTLKAKLLQLMPLSDIDLTVRARAYALSGVSADLLGGADASGSDDWDRALDALDALRAQEAPTAFYYGVAPFDCTAFRNNGGGTAGLGNQGNGSGPTSALGFDANIDSCTPFTAKGWQTMAHELGHTLSLGHAPCSNGIMPAGIESFWRMTPQPWSGANVAKLSPAALFDGVNLLDPATTGLTSPPSGTDIMAYCGGEWFSEYTYHKMAAYLRDNDAVAQSQVMTQRAQAQTASTVQLRISGLIKNGAQALISPPLLTSGLTPTVNAGSHVLRLVTASGQVIRQRFTPLRVADAPMPTEHFAVTLADPGQISGIAIEKDGVELTTTLRQPPTAAMKQERAAPSYRADVLAAPNLTESGGRVEVTWNARLFPWLTLAHVALSGQRTVLALHATGGVLNLPLAGLPAGGQWELHQTDGLNARQSTLARP